GKPERNIYARPPRHRGARSQYIGRSIYTPRSAISISRSDDLDTEVRDLDIEVGASRHRDPRSRYRGPSISTPRSAISISRSEHLDTEVPRSRYRGRSISTPRSATSISRSEHLDTEVRDLDIEFGACRH